MEYDPLIHSRRSRRLREYDYSQAGAYFVTVCTHDRTPLLESTPIQDLASSAWHALPKRFPSVALDEFVAMPNHVHGIIILVGAANGAPPVVASAASGGPTLGQVVRAFKSVSAIEANRLLSRSGQAFWQRNYYEHVIRGDGDLDRIRRYIRDNPLKWNDDPDNPANL